MQIAKILCPIDFGECSRDALASAVALARATKAKIDVLHVLPTIGTKEETAIAERALNDAVPADLSDVVAERRIVRAVLADEAVLAAVSQLRPDLVVIGTHGRTGWRHALLGSVAEKVVQLAPCPVLTVRQTSRRIGEHGIRRILCAFDFSPAARAALAYAAELAHATLGELIVVHVVEPMIEPIEYGAPMIARAQLEPSALERVRVELGKAVDAVVKGSVRTRVGVEIGDPTTIVCNRAKSDDVDAIVLASRGLTGLKRLLLGSTAELIVRTAERPVLVIKSPER